MKIKNLSSNKVSVGDSPFYFQLQLKTGNEKKLKLQSELSRKTFLFIVIANNE